ncbi:hypothetical protein PC122_g7088 [Phytophthora cactorum]|nr:hypothetical protein PC122_g7088 [Phytophthora cactorum]
MTDGNYMKHLLKDAFFEGDHVPPETVPVASIWRRTFRTGVMAFPVRRILLRRHCMSTTLQRPVEKAGVAELAVLQEPAEDPKGATKAGKRKKRRAKKKPATMRKETSGFEIQLLPADPCLERPRMKQQANVRLSDYVVGLVQATTDVRILTTYKQVLAPVESCYAGGT